MEKILLFFSLLSIVSLSAQTDHDLDLLIEAEMKSHLTMQTAPGYSGNRGFDIKYHRFEWDIDPNVRYIKGAVFTRFQSLSDGLSVLEFDLSESLEVDSIIFNGNIVSYQRPGNAKLMVQLNQPIPDFGMDSLLIYYQGVPDETGFGSFGMKSHGPDNTPVVWTLSEPYGALDWRPVKQDLNDRVDSIDVWITTPLGFRAASNGILVSEQTNNNKATFHWKHRYSIPAYLVAFAVTNYAVYSDYYVTEDQDSIEVLNYVYPENLADAQSRTPNTVSFMGLFHQLVGPYPFANEKYGHAQCGFGGGMEHSTMSFMGGFSSGLQAHELAHQWFGDKVTCGSWQDIWLNEGFATYFEGLTYEAGLRFGSWDGWLRSKIQHVTTEPGGSVWVNDTTSVSRIFSSRLSYSKGAMVLHMLRWKLGDQDFFQALKNYLEDPALAYGFAKTGDLKRHLEAQSGKDLTDFFIDWIYREGYPVYRIHWTQPRNEKVNVWIEQTPSHQSVSYFKLPVPLRLIGLDKDTIVVADNTFFGQEFTFDPGFEVVAIDFDPEIKLLAVLEGITVSNKERFEEEKSIRLSPNPVAHTLSLSGSGLEGCFEIKILDLNGRVIKTILSPKPDFSMDIDTSDLDSGIYILEASNQKGEKRVARFVKS